MSVLVFVTIASKDTIVPSQSGRHAVVAIESKETDVLWFARNFRRCVISDGHTKDHGLASMTTHTRECGPNGRCLALVLCHASVVVLTS